MIRADGDGAGGVGVETVSDDRLPALDGLRGLAILFVLQYHVATVGRSLIREPDSALLPIDRFVFNVFGAGWAGVDLFFVLSGFLITGILVRAKEGTHYFRSFYARRFLRIFPLYYAFLVFIFLLYPLVRDLDGSIFVQIFDVKPEDRLWFITYTQNYPMAIPDLHPDSIVPMTYLWSLAVEEQFYIVWPLVVLLSPRRALPWVCLALMIGALVLRWFMVHAGWGWAAANYSTYFFTPARIDTLAAGALVACLAHYGERREFRIAAVVIAVACIAPLAAMAYSEGTLHNFSDPVRVYGYSLLAVVFAAILFLVVSSRSAPGVLRGATLGGFAAYSYAIYVLHPAIFSEVALGIRDSGGFPTMWGSYLPSMIVWDLVLVAMSFAAGWLSWQLYEKHFLKLKRFFPYGSPRAAPAPPVEPAPLPL